MMNIPALEAQHEVKDTPKAPLVLIQSLRGIAALMVVFFHLYLWRGKYFSDEGFLPGGLSGGESGVDLFFVISGFIMMHITPKAHRSWRDQGLFLFRRGTRIYPAYWAVAVTLLFVWLWNPHLINNYENNQVDVPASLLLYPGQHAPILFVGWTLVCELTYYVIASFLFYFEGMARMVGVLLWSIIILTVNIVHPHRSTNPWIDTFFIALTLEFTGGMVLASLLRKGLRRVPPAMAGFLIAISFSVIILWGWWHGPYVGSGGHENTSRVFFYGVPAFIIVWMILQMDIQGEWQWLKKLAPLGDRSYSLYLVQVPVIATVFRVVAAIFHTSQYYQWPLAAVGTFVALILPVECLHQFVEKPSHLLARRLTSQKPARARL
jgi:exopolysaccharide production protein ExoZ